MKNFGLLLTLVSLNILSLDAYAQSVSVKINGQFYQCGMSPEPQQNPCRCRYDANDANYKLEQLFDKEWVRAGGYATTNLCIEAKIQLCTK